MTNNDIGFVLIHGAGLNKSIWNDLTEQVKSPALAIDFPNRNGGDKVNLNLTFDDYINSVITQIEAWNIKSFIVVGHSIGACVALKIATHFKNNVVGFVAISSVVPLNKNSFASALPFPQNLILPLMLSLLGTNPPKKSTEASLCNDLNPEQTARVVNNFTPESKALYTTKIEFDLPEVPRLYIKLTNDKSMPIPLQEKMAKNLNADKVESIHSGHLPMMANPKALAAVLINFLNNIRNV